MSHFPEEAFKRLLEVGPAMKDGKLENFLLTVDGKPYRCSCGANVFHKPDATNLKIYKCNGCELLLEAE